MKTRRTLSPFIALADDALELIIAELHASDPAALRAAALVCHQWRQRSLRAGLMVYLVGRTPGMRHLRFLGSYIIRDEVVNQRPSYVKVGDPGKLLWYNADEFCWFAGIASEVGQNRGRLVAESSAATPAKIHATWEIQSLPGSDYESAGGWQLASDVRCSSDRIAEEEAEALRQSACAERDAMANAVHLVSDETLTPEHSRYMGMYERIGEGLINWRPAYQKCATAGRTRTDIAMWFDGRNWVAGARRDLGKAKACLAAQDDAVAPEFIVGPWQVNNVSTGDWPVSPSIRCVQSSQLPDFRRRSPRTLTRTIRGK